MTSLDAKSHGQNKRLLLANLTTRKIFDSTIVCPPTLGKYLCVITSTELHGSQEASICHLQTK